MRELLDELRQLIATLEGTKPESVVIAYGARPHVDLLDVDGEPLKSRRRPFDALWSPPGGGTIEFLPLEAAVAHAMRHTAEGQVRERERAVREAREALERAERSLAGAQSRRDRLTAIVDEGVAAARAVRAASAAAKPPTDPQT